MRNGRCRMHGGASTGPKTERGLARSRQANWKHGCYSAKSKLQAKLLHQLLGECRGTVRDIAGLAGQVERGHQARQYTRLPRYGAATSLRDS